MIIIFFILITLLQIYLYRRVDNKKLNKNKSFVTFVILCVYFLFPFIMNFIIEQKEVVSNSNYIETKCLLPIVSLFLGLWIFGLIITIITATFYFIYKKIEQKKKSINN